MIRMLSAKWSGLLRFKPGDFDGLLTAFRGAGFAARVSRFELKYRNGLPPGVSALQISPRGVIKLIREKRKNARMFAIPKYDCSYFLSKV